jgi:hypothetical protein
MTTNTDNECNHSVIIEVTGNRIKGVAFLEKINHDAMQMCGDNVTVTTGTGSATITHDESNTSIVKIHFED